ncbi:MAG: G5 domain-containing protein [Clostridia bacterium]|nr:G5 domain-containing protein [Clostridia bacterium]MBR2417870.1 G5 domain-containing protein [Clostridia bacterium]
MNYSKKATFYNNYLPKIQIAGIIIGSVILFFALVATVLYFTVNVTAVFCDDQVQTVYSFTSDNEKILAKTPFTLSEKDKLIPYEAENGRKILAVAKEHTVKVYDGKRFIKKVKVVGTVRDAVEKAGVKLRDGDEADQPLDFGITDNITIKVIRGFKVTLTADGKTRKVNFSGGTVKQLLRKEGIVLSDIDIVEPSINEKVNENDEVIVKRVKYKDKTVKGKVLFETKVEYDDSKFEDEAKVKTKGKNGKKIDTVREIYVDGEYLKTEIIHTEITKKPVTKVVVRGSKARPGGYLSGYVSGKRVISELTPPFKIELDENNRPIKYKKVIRGKATAYCTGTTCSTGVRAMPGRVAVDPREIPYGTKMYIVSSDGRWHYGYATASDTGGFIYNSNTVVDLYMRSYTDCVNFGRRNVDIYIL